MAKFIILSVYHIGLRSGDVVNMPIRDASNFANHNISNISENEVLEWKLIGKIWHNWELHYDGKIVASLKSKRFFTLLFEGSYDGNEIVIRKDLSNRAKIAEKHKGTYMGTIEPVDFLPTKFTDSEGRTFPITSPIFRTIEMHADSKTEKRCLCITVFNNASFPVDATFRTVKIQPDDQSPWLLAVISLYVAIATSYSNV